MILSGEMHVAEVYAYLECLCSLPPRYDSHSGGEREIQRTMLELLNQLDGFDSRGDVKVRLGMGLRSVHVVLVIQLFFFVGVARKTM